MTLKYVKGTPGGGPQRQPGEHRGSCAPILSIRGAIFQTTSDTELISYAIAHERLTAPSVEEAVSRALPMLKGAFSLIVMSPETGGRPGSPGASGRCASAAKGDAILFASESCALDGVEASMSGRLSPGRSWWWRTARCAPSGTTARA